MAGLRHDRFGVLLISSPFIFGETSSEVAARSAYVLGGLLALSGVVAAATPEARRSLLFNAPGLVSVITFISPFALGFGGVTGIAWTAWLLAIATVVVASSFRFSRRSA
jgi:hypothetical protein